MENGQQPIEEPPPPDDGKEPKPRKDSDPDPPGQYRLDVKSFGAGALFGVILGALLCGRGCERARC